MQAIDHGVEVLTRRKFLVLLWIAFFAYSTSIALLFQLLILPLFPGLQVGNFAPGLVGPDSVFFHDTAIQLAKAIAAKGWEAWTPWPPPNAHGNTAVLGALYAIFGPNFAVVIPINASLHATSAILLILIGQQIFPGRTAFLGSVWAACLFVGFPSALNWYGQAHKDGYAILGFFLLIYAGLLALRHSGREKLWLMVVTAVCGLALSAFVRPHNIQLFLLMAVMALMFAGWRKFAGCGGVLQAAVFAVMIVGAAAVIRNDVAQTIDAREIPKVDSSGDLLQIDRLIQSWRWSPSPWAPALLDRAAEKLSRLRVSMSAYALRDGGTSNIDQDRLPSSLLEMVAFLPRALWVGLFAPFPSSWTDKISLTRLVGAAEVLVWYSFVPGLLWLAWRNRKNHLLWWVVGVVLTLLTAQSYVTANLGTLHRVRYSFIFLLLLCGAIGWVQMLNEKWRGSALGKGIQGLAAWRSMDSIAPPLDEPVGAGNNRKLLKHGAVIGLLTGVFLLGLFFRDLILARVLGLGAELDRFQLASFLPMFTTALLAVPLGPVLIGHFVHLRERSGEAAAKTWVKAMSAFLLAVFAALACAVVLISWLGAGKGAAVEPGTLLLWFIPVVALSASVVLGNSVLMSLNQGVLVSLAQLGVPLLSIALIVLWGESWGAATAAAGLMLGQLLNYVLIAAAARRVGYGLVPVWGDIRLRQWGGQYVPLLASAAVTGAAIPVGIYMASSLPEGNVAAFGLGAKVIQFGTSIVSATLVSVLLPYFSKLFAERKLQEMRRSLRTMLIVGTGLSLPIALLVFSEAQLLADLLFTGGRIGADEAGRLAQVIRFGVLQFPFYVTLIILIKYALAGKQAKWIFFAAVAGQIVNVACGTMLMGKLGIAGLAVAMSLGVAVSAAILLLWAALRGHMSFMSLTLVLTSWLLFLSLVVCFYQHNLTGILISLIAMAVLFFADGGLFGNVWRKCSAA